MLDACAVNSQGDDTAGQGVVTLSRFLGFPGLTWHGIIGLVGANTATKKCILFCNKILFLHRKKQHRNIAIENHLQYSFNSLWSCDAIRPHMNSIILVQAMACCLMAPIHCLNQHWLIISEWVWHSLEGNLTKNDQISVLDMSDFYLLLLSHLLVASEFNGNM